MYCAACGQRAKDGTHFCPNCGAPLQEAGAVTYAPPSHDSNTSAHDPYKERIDKLKLELRQLRLDLKQVKTGMANTRSQYYETAAFVPHGVLRRGYKWLENLRLWRPQMQKQDLQEQVMQLEQELLNLQQAQADWKAQRR